MDCKRELAAEARSEVEVPRDYSAVSVQIVDDHGGVRLQGSLQVATQCLSVCLYIWGARYLNNIEIGSVLKKINNSLTMTYDN